MIAIVDLTPAAQRLSELVRHIDEDQLGAPTPSGIPVAGMLDHVGGLAVAFAAAAAKATARPPTWSSMPATGIPLGVGPPSWSS